MRTEEFYPFVELYQPGVLMDVGAAIGGVAQGTGAAVAAHMQSDAATHAANLQSQAAANSLAFQQNEFNTTQANQKPFLQAGQAAIGNIAQEVAPGGWAVTPYDKKFNAPAPFSFTAADFQQDPAYQFNLQQGQQAIQRSAAAQGGALNAGTLKDLSTYTQGMAGNEWQNAYGNAFNTYQANYSNALTNYQNAYNVWSNNQNNSFNRQAAVAGIGQTSAGQLASSGAAAAGLNAQTNLAGAAGAGNYLSQAGVAGSAGIMGLTNAFTNANNAGWNALNYSSYGKNAAGINNAMAGADDAFSGGSAADWGSALQSYPEEDNEYYPSD
jgi:hypothetical protein